MEMLKCWAVSTVVKHPVLEGRRKRKQLNLYRLLSFDIVFSFSSIIYFQVIEFYIVEWSGDV